MMEWMARERVGEMMEMMMTGDSLALLIYILSHHIFKQTHPLPSFKP